VAVAVVHKAAVVVLAALVEFMFILTPLKEIN
jgi:hypothetical protein